MSSASQRKVPSAVLTWAGPAISPRIDAGWVLHVPLPSTAVEEVDGQVYYTVERGDTLSGIAARLLGNESRWPDIFALNKGVARLDGGPVLHQAN